MWHGYCISLGSKCQKHPNNNNGFSPAQIVFGKNCMFPSIINNNLPALESFNQSQNLALHIAALHSARRAFIACESSEKIKQA